MNPDIHIDASQNGSMLSCTKCDYKTSYRNILEQHMKTHTEMNQTNDLIFKLVSDIRNAKDNELPVITSETTFDCSVCVFKCGVKSDLNKHLKSHSIFACDKCEYRGHSLQGLNAHNKIHNNKK